MNRWQAIRIGAGRVARLTLALRLCLNSVIAIWVASSHGTQHPGHGISPSLLLSLHRAEEGRP